MREKAAAKKAKREAAESGAAEAIPEKKNSVLMSEKEK